MLKELSWYIESGRFTAIVDDIEEKALAYEDSLRNKSSCITECREEFRELCQWHVEKSGYKNCNDSFVSVDDEFFTGNELNRKALETFEKEIIKAHMYQKHLWEFMGTTGGMTVISKAAMKRDKFKYDSLIPMSERDRINAKSPIAKELLKNPNSVPIYMYPDGSISTSYDHNRAKYCFDSLKDNSGFDWHKEGWDPNYEVTKNGWYSEYDANKVWTRYNSEKKSESLVLNRNADTDRFQSLELLKDECGGILYDPGYSLLSIPEIVYLLLDGGVYGSEKVDVMRTVNEIRSVMKKMNIERICAVAVDKNVADVSSYAADKTSFVKNAGVKEFSAGSNISLKDDADAIRRYRDILGDIAAENLELKNLEDYKGLKKASLKKFQNAEKQTAGKNLFINMQTVLKNGIEGASVFSCLKSGKIEMPYSFDNEDDSKIIGLSDSEYKFLCKLKLPEEKKKFFEHVVMNFLGFYEMLKDTGIKKEELIEYVYKKIILDETDDRIVSIERSFEDLCLAENFDFHCQKTEDSTLKILEEEINKLSPQKNKETQQKVDRALANVELNFKAIRESTGMLPSEAVLEAVKIAGGKQNTTFVPPVSGIVYKTPLTEQSCANKRIFFDIHLNELLEEAVSAPSLTKTVSLEEISSLPNFSVNKNSVPNLFDKQERKNWIESAEFKKYGLQKDDFESFALELEEKFDSAATDLSFSTFFSSGIEELNERYGISFVHEENADGCIVAKIEPKTTSDKAATVADRLNKSVNAITDDDKQAAPILDANYSPVETVADGRLSRKLAEPMAYEYLTKPSFIRSEGSIPFENDSLERLQKTDSLTTDSAKNTIQKNIIFDESNPSERNIVESDVIKSNVANVSFIKDSVVNSEVIENDLFEVGAAERKVSKNAVIEGSVVNREVIENDLFEVDAAERKVSKNAVIEGAVANREVIENDLFDVGTVERKAARSAIVERNVANSEIIENAVFEVGATERKVARSAIVERNVANSEVIENEVFEIGSAERKVVKNAVVKGSATNSIVSENDIAESKSFEKGLKKTLSCDEVAESPAVTSDAVSSRMVPKAEKFSEDINPIVAEPAEYAADGANSILQSSNRTESADSEKAKIERMTSNYEHDRAILAKTDPAFSKTTFRDVGHAISDSEFEHSEKTSMQGLHNSVINDIDTELL